MPYDIRSTITFALLSLAISSQQAMLDLTLEICSDLDNKALTDRKDAYVVEAAGRGHEDQAAMPMAEKL